MEIALKINKTVEQNAAAYFEKAKKLRKKSAGAKKALEIYKAKLQTEQNIPEEQQAKAIQHLKKEWYEKFKWFFTSDGFLVVAGKDATSNEIVIKKHAEKNDLVFHTNMAGSPFAVIKAENKQIPEQSIAEAGSFVFVHSRAWKLGFVSEKVFYVNPDQVTKTAKSGEFLPKGAFVIMGKVNYLQPSTDFAVGVYNDKIMGGPSTAIKKLCKEVVELISGDMKSSDLAKLIKKKLGWSGSLDDIAKVLPSGGCAVKSK